MLNGSCVLGHVRAKVNEDARLPFSFSMASLLKMLEISPIPLCTLKLCPPVPLLVTIPALSWPLETGKVFEERHSVTSPLAPPRHCNWRFCTCAAVRSGRGRRPAPRPSASASPPPPRSRTHRTRGSAPWGATLGNQAASQPPPPCHPLWTAPGRNPLTKTAYLGKKKKMKFRKLEK